ncbi:MAG: hypothetical protein BroJett015_15290 [Chloroflexota bacterium]|nr:hypothetical protein [Chloroflexota bacterium]GIK55866.1 MAG: hypothetical protein BroJett015_15290 [Chloroflexota bacterium]
MKYKLSIFVALVGIGVLFVFSTGSALAHPGEEVQGYWLTTTAYTTGAAFYDPWWRPHYGAFFIGSTGKNQHYLGQVEMPQPAGQDLVVLARGIGGGRL